jgi:hypothetical protein
MEIYLTGVAQVSIPKMRPFVVAAFLVSLNLETNQMRYQIIGIKSNPNPYAKNLNDCVKGLEKVNFFDCLTSYEFLGGDSINSMISFFGDIALFR